MITIFCQVDDEGMIHRVWEQDVPEVGPSVRIPVARAGTRYEILAQPFDLQSPPTPSSRARLADGVAQWEQAAPLDELKAAAIAKTFADVDAVVFAAVGHRAVEYQDAETAARAYVAAGYAGEPDEDVAAYAAFNGTGQAQSNRWAADVIILRADAFRVAQRAMRSTRFERQCGMQAATTEAELDVVVTLWNSFIDGLRSQLGLPMKETV